MVSLASETVQEPEDGDATLYLIIGRPRLFVGKRPNSDYFVRRPSARHDSSPSSYSFSEYIHF